ncbi:carbohydrate kinase family protein [Demequina globuliformis]|uniref:carbohydrate kinase family protein n=1 Tax=Demequina globuliformis TaxID=676202 RepID=UPI00078526A7|nr:carbohydrate kinase [Demequina globuliformis]
MSGTALVIGEALVDVVVRADGTTAEHPGGSPANVAIGLGRLDRDVSLLTHLAVDARGQDVARHLEASHVRLAPGSLDADHTSVATATLDATGAATYVFDLEWALPAPEVTAAHPLVVHTGSVAAVLAPGASAVRDHVQAHREHATVTYDPNARPTLMGDPADARAAIEAMVALADVVKVSDEDLEWIARDGETVEDVAAGWLEHGPALVVVTRGGEGATALAPAGRIDVAALPVTVADTVGAGDSFMSGLIDGLWTEELLGADRRQQLRAIDADTLTRVLERCIRIAAITVSRAGANPPTTAELATA